MIRLSISPHAKKDIQNCRPENFENTPAYEMLLSEIRLILSAVKRIKPFHTYSVFGEEITIQKAGNSIGLFSGSIRLMEATLPDTDFRISYLHPDLLDESSEIAFALSELAELEQQQKRIQKTKVHENLAMTEREIVSSLRELEKDLYEINSITPETPEAEDRREWVFSRIDATRLRLMNLEKRKKKLEDTQSELYNDPQDDTGIPGKLQS